MSMSHKLLFNNITTNNKLIAWFDMTEIRIGDTSLKNKIDDTELVLSSESKVDGYLSDLTLTYQKPIDFRTVEFTFLVDVDSTLYSFDLFSDSQTLVRCYTNVQTVATGTIGAWVETPKGVYDKGQKVIVTITYESDKVNIYVDKQLIISKTGINVDFTKLNKSSWEMIISNTIKLYDVKFYNYALSQNEI